VNYWRPLPRSSPMGPYDMSQDFVAIAEVEFILLGSAVGIFGHEPAPLSGPIKGDGIHGRRLFDGCRRLIDCGGRIHVSIDGAQLI
jgi:hypothetical protein